MGEDYGVETDLGYVRFLISDVTSGDGQVFADAEIDAVMSRTPSVEIAAAVLLERVADNEALVAKTIRTQDLQTDGPKVAAALRESAARLRADHAANMDAAGGELVVIDYDPYPCSTWPELTERPC